MSRGSVVAHGQEPNPGTPPRVRKSWKTLIPRRAHAQVFFSGTLIASVANFILIGILGTHDEGAHRADDGGGYGGGRKHRDEAGVAAGGHTAAEAV